MRQALFVVVLLAVALTAGPRPCRHCQGHGNECGWFHAFDIWFEFAHGCDYCEGTGTQRPAIEGLRRELESKGSP